MRDRRTLLSASRGFGEPPVVTHDEVERVDDHTVRFTPRMPPVEAPSLPEHRSQEELDAVRAKTPKAGRKRKRVEVARPRVAQTNLSEDEMALMEAAALETGVTVSAWLRRLVLRELGRQS